jgi:hypothetical protein
VQGDVTLGRGFRLALLKVSVMVVHVAVVMVRKQANCRTKTNGTGLVMTRLPAVATTTSRQGRIRLQN